MAGTLTGGKKAAVTNKERYGKDFYAHIGSIGGKVCGPKGFALDPERARRAGSIGGSKSKRGPAKKKKVKNEVA